MYSRYIPQPDGTYRRSRMQDPTPPQRGFNPPPRREDSQQTQPHSAEPEPQTAQPCHEPPKAPPCPRRPSRQAPPCRQPQPVCESRNDGSVGGFLRNLLPKDFDTGDLLIVLLLLLMAGDCKDDQNTALLTLALYLFM